MDRWLMSQVEQQANKLSNVLGVRSVYVNATNKIISTVRDRNKTVPSPRKLLLNSKTVRLKSRSTDKYVQIVRRSSDGAMIVDANGIQEMFNNVWAIDVAQNEHVRIHNSFNFVCYNSRTKRIEILHVPPEQCPPPESCEWIILSCFRDRDFVIFESAISVGTCLSFSKENGDCDVNRDKLDSGCHQSVFVVS
ncbi:hypothetical protein ACOME3_004115 [Neoechinorhynchus agilis]